MEHTPDQTPPPKPQFIRFPNCIIHVRDIGVVVPARSDRMEVGVHAPANGVKVWFRSGGHKFLPRETLDSFESHLNGAAY